MWLLLWTKPTSCPPSVQVPLSLWPEIGRQGSNTENELTHTAPTDRLMTEEKEVRTISCFIQQKNPQVSQLNVSQQYKSFLRHRKSAKNTINWTKIEIQKKLIQNTYEWMCKSTFLQFPEPEWGLPSRWKLLGHEECGFLYGTECCCDLVGIYD